MYDHKQETQSSKPAKAPAKPSKKPDAKKKADGLQGKVLQGNLSERRK